MLTAGKRSIMLPSEYGLSAYSPESYVAIAVEDLIEKAGKASLCRIAARTAEKHSGTRIPQSGRQPKRKSLTCSAPEQMMNKKKTCGYRTGTQYRPQVFLSLILVTNYTLPSSAVSRLSSPPQMRFSPMHSTRFPA